MVNLSKQAWRVFERNMNKSWGLLKMQFYADDLIRTGGKESIGKISQFLADMMSSFGLGQYASLEDMVEKELVPVIERELMPKFEARVAGITEKELEARGQKWLEENTELFEELKRDFAQLMLVVENVLLEQALVTAVTAFEVYVRDVTEEVLAKNVYMQKRFTTELHKNVNYAAILESRGNLAKAIGNVAAGCYKFNDPKNLRSHIGRLVGKRNPLSNPRNLNAFADVLAYRHLIVHRGGLVDRKFVRATGYKGRMGGPVKLSYAYVESVLILLNALAKRTQEALMLQKATSPGS
jgi:hypothetical protein